MKSSDEIIAKMRGLNESAFRELIGEVTRASGMSEAARRAAMAQAGMIRKRLQSTSEKEIMKIVNSIGQEKAEQILDKFSR